MPKKKSTPSTRRRAPAVKYICTYCAKKGNIVGEVYVCDGCSHVFHEACGMYSEDVRGYIAGQPYAGVRTLCPSCKTEDL